jgi:hypothetical protein
VDRSVGFVPVASSYQLRVFGAFSRRLRENMVRVDAETESRDVLPTAYEGEGGRRTMVLINQSTAPQAVRIAWPGAAFTDREMVSPYSPNLVAPAEAGPVLIQPGEIVTLSTAPVGGR